MPQSLKDFEHLQSPLIQFVGAQHFWKSGNKLLKIKQ